MIGIIRTEILIVGADRLCCVYLKSIFLGLTFPNLQAKSPVMRLWKMMIVLSSSQM